MNMMSDQLLNVWIDSKIKIIQWNSRNAGMGKNVGRKMWWGSDRPKVSFHPLSIPIDSSLLLGIFIIIY